MNIDHEQRTAPRAFNLAPDQHQIDFLRYLAAGTRPERRINLSYTARTCGDQLCSETHAELSLAGEHLHGDRAAGGSADQAKDSLWVITLAIAAVATRGERAAAPVSDVEVRS